MADFWILGNLKTRYQSDKIDLKTVIAKLAAVPEEELNLWVVWKSDWPQWKAVLDVTELQRTKAPPMPPPAPVVAPPVMPAPRHAVVEDKATGKNMRQHPRYKIRLRVIIKNEELTFRTFTTDISLGGVALENPLPQELFNKDCKIFIADSSSMDNIRFTLKLTNRGDLRYFSFADLEESFVEKLRAWFKPMENIAKAS